MDTHWRGIGGRSLGKGAAIENVFVYTKYVGLNSVNHYEFNFRNFKDILLLFNILDGYVILSIM